MRFGRISFPLLVNSRDSNLGTGLYFLVDSENSFNSGQNEGTLTIWLPFTCFTPVSLISLHLSWDLLDIMGLVYVSVGVYI